MPEQNRDTILVPGDTCWRVGRSDRVSFLVDAGPYFDVLVAALTRARRSVWILGWDIHSRLCLQQGADTGEDSAELAALLDAITERQPELEVRILTWDPAPLFLLEREFLPPVQFTLRTHERVHVHMASDHPTGASHHQKIVVIDESLAFVGGIDLTVARWDTPEHRPEDPRRHLPNGTPYGPFHDVQVAVEGPPAAALAELARQRWLDATGEEVDRVAADHDPWPEALAPDGRRMQVAIARTQARYEKRPAVREVEALFLRAIATAQRTIYIENQYLTSDAVCTALCQCLSRRDGPEVLIVTPAEQAGRLEQLSMGALRARVVRRLRTADVHDRLRMMSPIVGGDVPVNVHAKVMIVDDRLARIGSANLTNRSMSLDTECDLAIEAGTDPQAHATVQRLRNRLLAEHLDVEVERIATEFERLGSLVAVVDALAGGTRTLQALEVDDIEPGLLADPSIADPACPLTESLARRALPDDAARESWRRFPRVVLGLVAMLAVGAFWLWILLTDWPTASDIAARLEPLTDSVLGIALATGMFALATLLLFSVNVLCVAAVLLFGPWTGVLVSMVGGLVSALAGYGLGRVLWHDTIERVAGKRLRRLSEQLARRGIVAVVTIRLVPVAPFTVANMVAGMSRIRLVDFAAGTFIGMLPGILLIAFASSRIFAALRNPSTTTILVASGTLLLAVAVVFAIGRFLRRWRRSAEEHTEAPVE